MAAPGFPRQDTGLKYTIDDEWNRMQSPPTPPRAVSPGPLDPRLRNRPATVPGMVATAPATSLTGIAAVAPVATAPAYGPPPRVQNINIPVLQMAPGTSPATMVMPPAKVQELGAAQVLPTEQVELLRTPQPTQEFIGTAAANLQPPVAWQTGPTYTADMQTAPGTTQTVDEVVQGAPLAPIVERAAPLAPVFMPRHQIVDRHWHYAHPGMGIPVPFPVAHPQYYPSPVTHTFKQVAPHYDHDFPYHDPAFGSGWRFHYPDNLDEALLGMGTYRPTPLDEMRHAAFESQMKEEWINAHVAESQYGVKYRHLPYSRRVRLPERLIPDPEDYSEIIL